MMPQPQREACREQGKESERAREKESWLCESEFFFFFALALFRLSSESQGRKKNMSGKR